MPESNQTSKDKGLSGEFIIQQAKQSGKDAKNAPDVTKVSKNQEFDYNNIPLEDISQRIGPFTALSYNPDGVIFKDQEQGERIILLVRRHFVTNLPWILEFIAIILVPVFFAPFLPAVFSFINISTAARIAIFSLYYLASFAFVLINFTVWYFNLDIVTNHRIVDIDASGILYKEVAETKLELIEDISYEQTGALASFFNYGNILIQTAAEKLRFEFDQAPEPAKILHILGELIGKEK